MRCFTTSCKLIKYHMKHFLRFFSYLHLFFELNYELILSPHPAIYKTYVKLKKKMLAWVREYLI